MIADAEVRLWLLPCHSYLWGFISLKFLYRQGYSGTWTKAYAPVSLN